MPVWLIVFMSVWFGLGIFNAFFWHRMFARTHPFYGNWEFRFTTIGWMIAFGPFLPIFMLRMRIRQEWAHNPITRMQITPTMLGYWLIPMRGQAIPFGDAYSQKFHAVTNHYASYGIEPECIQLDRHTGKLYRHGSVTFEDLTAYADNPIGVVISPTHEHLWAFQSDGTVQVRGLAQHYGDLNGRCSDYGIRPPYDLSDERAYRTRLWAACRGVEGDPHAAADRILSIRLLPEPDDTTEAPPTLQQLIEV